MTDDERAIRATVDLWLAASRRGDVATVLSLMTDDVLFLVPGQEPFGKQRFASLSAGMDKMKLEGSSEIQELEVAGDWAFLRNSIEMIATPLSGGQPMRRRGHTLSIFRKEADGKWRLSRDANLMAGT